MDDDPALEPLTESFASVLVVVAHPDDIEYGMSAAVAKWTGAAATVTYFLLSRGEAGIDTMRPEDAGPAREEEEREAGRRVGVEAVDFGTWRDGAIEAGLALRRDIALEIRRRRPEAVLTQTYAERFAGGTVNQADHRAVGLATLDAVADAGNRWIFPELLAQGFPPWDGVRLVGFGGSPTPNRYVDVSGHFEAAVSSLEAHAAYNEALPDDFPTPRDLLTMLLGSGGEAVGTEHALLLDVIER